MTDIDNKNLKFNNKTNAEFQTFHAKLRTFARMKGANCFKAFSSDGIPDVDMAEGNAELYDLIITHTSCPILIQTISNRFTDDGSAALAYIASSWAPGKSEAKAKAAAKEYIVLQSTPLGAEVTVETLRLRLNTMANMRAQLNGTSRNITEQAHCNNIWDMVGEVHESVEMSLKIMSLEWDDVEWTDINYVSSCLEDAITEYDGKRAKKNIGANIPSDNIDKLVAALAGFGNGRQPRGGKGAYAPFDFKNSPPCDECGAPHPQAGDPKKCHTVIRSEGRTPSGWENKPEHLKAKMYGSACRGVQTTRTVEQANQGWCCLVEYSRDAHDTTCGNSERQCSLYCPPVDHHPSRLWQPEQDRTKLPSYPRQEPLHFVR